jgi:hypothetical protein
LFGMQCAKIIYQHKTKGLNGTRVDLCSSNSNFVGVMHRDIVLWRRSGSKYPSAITPGAMIDRYNRSSFVLLARAKFIWCISYLTPRDNILFG